MGAAGAADIPADLREAIPPQLNAGQKAIVALKVRELLQPMAKERQRDAGGDHGNQFTGGKLALPADLREPPTPQLSAGQRAAAALKIHAGMAEEKAERKRRERESAAQAAKIVSASPRAVEQAARVAKSAPDLIPCICRMTTGPRRRGDLLALCERSNCFLSGQC